MITSPIYPSHDGLIHAERIRQFHLAISNGQIPPRLAPTLYDGIGYPLFVVNYQLPYYFAEFFMLFSRDPIFSYKAVMSVSYLLSGVFAFFLFRSRASHLASLLGAIIYSYLPYRFANLYTRGSFGESVALLFIPLVFIALNAVFRKERYSTILLATSIFGLITSHTIIFMIFLPLFLLYALIILMFNIHQMIKVVLGIILGVFLSSFQMFPSIFEKKFLTFDSSLLGLFNGHFSNIFQLLRIPLAGINTGTAFQIGASASIVLVISFLYAIFRKPQKTTIFFLIFVLVSLILMQRQSSWLWNHVLMLQYVLYPWRFLSIIIISTAFLSVFLVDNLKMGKYLAILLIFIAIFTARHYYLKPSLLTPNTITESTTTQNEYDTIWSTETTFNKRPIVGDSTGSLLLTGLENSGTNLNFIATTEQVTLLTVRKLFFPGWQLKVNGQEKPILVDNGLISFPLYTGQWEVELEFRETKLRKFANFVSLASLLLILAVAIRLWLTNFYHKISS